jgi:hypothetical protein
VCARDLGACGRIRITAHDFEEDVLGPLFSRIDPQQLHMEPEHDESAQAMAELDRLEALKAELARMAGAGELGLEQFRAAPAASERAMQSLRQAMARSAEEEALQQTRAEAVDLWAKWDELDIDSRRRVVQALAERIEVGSAIRGRNF